MIREGALKEYFLQHWCLYYSYLWLNILSGFKLLVISLIFAIYPSHPISMMLWATWCMYFGLILEIPWRFYSFLFFNNHSKTSLTSHIQVLKVHDVRIRPSDNFSCERDFICVGIKKQSCRAFRYFVNVCFLFFRWCVF